MNSNSLAFLFLGLVLSVGALFSDVDDFANPGASLSEADYEFSFGRKAASYDDADSDGYKDVLVGAYYNDDNGSNAGKTCIVSGSNILASSGTIDISSAVYSVLGKAAGDWLGYSVASVNDIDGDGISEVLIGAPYNDDNGSNAGAAYLVFSSTLRTAGTLNLSSSNADCTFLGANTGDLAGWSVVSPGDVDGDGVSDIMISAIYEDEGGSESGKVYLILGSSILASSGTINLSDADFTLRGRASSDNAGWSLGRVGDVDGDGLDDLLIGSRQADEAYLIFASELLNGSVGSTLTGSDYIFQGSGALGYSVAGAGDVDGDGLGDILIGAYGANEAYLVLASSLGSDPSPDLSTGAASCTFGGETDGYAGNDIASAGDVDADGLSDLLIGAWSYKYNGMYTPSPYLQGRVYLILASSLTSSSVDLSAQANYIFDGESNTDYAGSAVTSVGDIDQDGGDDILLGASGAGKMYLVLSSICQLDPDFNYVTNPSADSGTTGWLRGGKARVSIVGGNPRFVLPREGDYFYQQIAIPTGAGNASISARVKAFSETVMEGYPFVLIVVSDSSGNVVDMQITPPGMRKKWIHVSTDFGLDSSATTVSIFLMRSYTTGRNDFNRAMFDDIEVKFDC